MFWMLLMIYTKHRKCSFFFSIYNNGRHARKKNPLEMEKIKNRIIKIKKAIFIKKIEKKGAYGETAI